MTARWVAGSVRARALARRRLGATGAHDLARSPSLDDALRVLASSPYAGQLPARATLAQAQRAVADTLLWHLRVLAGWLPREASDVIRVLAGWFELANVDERLSALAGRAGEPPYDLGALGIVSARLAATMSPAQVRQVLAASPWGDPGGDDAPTITLGTRLLWAERVCARVPEARPWARAAVVLLLARQPLLPEPAAASVRRVLGPRALAAGSVGELASVVGRDARWSLQDVLEGHGLWRAEGRWWQRVEADGTAMLRQAGSGPEPVVGAVALLAVDAWRARAALEGAVRGGSGPVLEVLDALA